MDRAALLAYLAPCGLRCGDCLSFVDGPIGRLAAELRGRLGNFGAFAERFAGYDLAFAEYPAFERLLEKLAAPACPGCRAAGPNGCLHSSCAVRPCARDKNVDFCFQCGDFPCDRHGFPPPLAERWRRNNDRMNAVGPDAFAEEVRHTPRY